MIDFTVLNAALNKVILPAVTSQMYQKAPAWQLFGGWSAKESVAKRANINIDRFENNNLYIPLRTSNHSGVVSIAVGEKYNYGNPTLGESYTTIKTIVGSFQIPKAVLNTTDKGAIVKPLLFSTQTLSNDLAMDANRQVYGNGDGVIATTASSGTSETTVALTPSTNGDIDFSRYFAPGTRIKIGSNAITTVDDQTGDNEITIADSQSWDASANIVKVTGSDTTSSELNGLSGMVAASGSYQNLDPATVTSWKSSVDATSETLYPNTIKQKMHAQYFKANKIGRVKWVVTNSSLFQTYGNGLTDNVRYEQKEVLAGGWVGLAYMAGLANVLLDYDCTDDRVYFLSDEELVFGQFQPLEWEKGTDGILFKIAQQLDYEVTASWMGNIGTVARAAQAMLDNKTASQVNP